MTFGRDGNLFVSLVRPKGRRDQLLFSPEGGKTPMRKGLTLTAVAALAFSIMSGHADGQKPRTVKQQSEYDRQAAIVAEAEKLQGVWTLDSKEVEGKPEPAVGASRTELSIHRTDFKLVYYHQKKGDPPALPAQVDGGRFKLVPLKNGTAIDFLSSVHTSGGKEQEQLGIYSLEGNVLTICVAPHGSKERPKGFSTKGTKNTTYVLVKKRDKIGKGAA
jgi:uncharacterized protein (TIGR03067 family)